MRRRAQARFTHRLMNELAGVYFPMERIFSQAESGRPKSEVLAALAAKAPPGVRMTFVEDKLSTLEQVAATPGLEGWQLYLGERRCLCCVACEHLLHRKASDAAPTRRHRARSGLGVQHAQGAGARARRQRGARAAGEPVADSGAAAGGRRLLCARKVRGALPTRDRLELGAHVCIAGCVFVRSGVSMSASRSTRERRLPAPVLHLLTHAQSSTALAAQLSLCICLAFK